MDEQTPSATYQLRIRDLPQGERPSERLRDQGPHYLSNAELLAILLRTGSSSENVINLATRVLSTSGGLAGLSKAGFRELTQVHGLGEAKVSQIVAALELGKRLSALPSGDRPVIGSPSGCCQPLHAGNGVIDPGEPAGAASEHKEPGTFCF